MTMRNIDMHFPEMEFGNNNDDRVFFFFSFFLSGTNDEGKTRKKIN
jgi:hypothetical protein